MEFSIENEHIRASFVSKGAELQHITGVDSGTEYLWKGDPNYWGKFSPVLFPIIGALKENIYHYEDRTYTLPRHGFARDMEFDVERISDHEILFTLRNTEETLKVYPFKFILKLRYKLTAATLSCTYEVSNPDLKEMLFSIGGHPAFAAPLNKQGSYTDYFLAFNADEVITYHHITENLISDETTTLVLDDKMLYLTHETFYSDALVIKNLKSNSVSLMNKKNYNGINFKFENFPYFGIWAAKDADFICLEPWCGIADSLDHNQQLKDKEGIITLAPSGEWQRTWKVTCF
ncbi:aldose 1-epimerase family protein [Pedobacter insulae]|uniref:Galactose mutarotase n=1 Tax=Pedobacter insulae TaxID=414048 RepID=A0A1I2TS27_9SPHI|nr:aldose 1-epimerase family protein [Pedobacter insulae]SFG65151.1 Galactose mutarotase [Pedobacter insulae]